MLFVLIALWIVACLIWLTDRRSKLHHRLGAVAFAGGAGALAAVIDLTWAPMAADAGLHPAGQRVLYRLQAFSSLFSYYGVPYFFLWFAITYNPIKLLSTVRLQRMAPFLLLIPIILCLVMTPGYNAYTPITYTVVIWWAVPYIAAGTLLIVMKRRVQHNRTHQLLCMALIPPVLFNMVMNYVLPTIGYYRMWVYNTWAIALAVTVFVIALFTYGFMGARVLLLRRRYNSALRTATSGSAVMNHAIKNDSGKIRLFTEKMKTYAIETKQPELLADVETVLSAAQHLQEMVQRIHKRTEEVQIKLQRTDLAELVKAAVRSSEPILGGVRCTVSCAEGWCAMVDGAHLTEVISNLIVNAVEAMKGSGELTIKLLEEKRRLIIEVSDTGPGMSKKQAREVFEPFYTTKTGGSNFGLGLSYSYAVMKEHKGELLLRTAPNEGAVFSMVLKKRETEAMRLPAAVKEAAYGENKHLAH